MKKILSILHALIPDTFKMRIIVFTILGILLGIFLIYSFFPGMCTWLGAEPNYGSSSTHEMPNGMRISTTDVVYKGCSFNIEGKLRKLKTILDPIFH